MLDVIRRNAHSLLLKIILGAIVIVFIFWGVGTFRSQRMAVVAKVNHEDILAGDYQQAYSQTIERYRQIFGGTIPEGFLKQFDIKKQVLNGLINDALIRQEAKKMGILVSDDEVRSAILGIPNFKRNGVFDKRLYNIALRESHMTPSVFEAMIRQQLLTDKVKAVLFSGLLVPETELKEYYRFQNEEIDAQFVKIPSVDCKSDVNATRAAIETWFEANKNHYETKPMIKLKYIMFSKDNVLKGVTVTDNAIASYYKSHKKDYQVKERRRVRHILIKVPQGADNATIAKKRKKALEILKLARGGKDFARLAKEYSEDPGSAERGGDLGFFTKGMLVRPFENKVFSMKEGEVAGPVRTRFGFHIIKLERIEPARTRQLDQVKGEIEEKLKQQKAKDILWDIASKAYDKIIQFGGLETYVKTEDTKDIKIKETALFSKDNPPLGLDKDALNALFALEPGELSSLIEVPKGIIIAVLTEKRPPEIPKLKAVYSQVKRDFIQEKAVDLCRDKAKKTLALAREKGLQAAASKMGLKVDETGFLKRTNPNKAGIPREVIQTALSLSSEKPLPDKPIQVHDTFYIVSFKARRPADPSGFASMKDRLKKMLISQKRDRLFGQWLSTLRERAKIEIYQRSS